MKRLITLLASLLLLGSAAAVAQEYVSTPVTISKEKVKLNDKIYLSHVVLERQTLFSIAKAYGVKWIPSMVVVGPDGKVKLSTVMIEKVEKYLKKVNGKKN